MHMVQKADSESNIACHLCLQFPSSEATMVTSFFCILLEIVYIFIYIFVSHKQ